MTTPTTTSTTTAAPATGTATATAGQGTASTADPAAGALFTMLLQSLGGPALAAGTTTATTGEGPLPGETAEEGTTGDGTAETAIAVEPTATLVPLVPTVLLVPAAAAETALSNVRDALEGVTAAAVTPAIAAGEAQPTVAEIPVAVTAAVTAAVADALPASPAPAEEPLSETGASDGVEDGEGAMPLPTGLTASTTTTASTTAHAAAAAQAGQATHVAAAQAATTAPAEPTTAVAPTGDRPERKERASASDAAAAAPNAEGQANTAATVAVTGGGSTADALEAEAAAGSVAHVDRERFEQLADGLAARLRVSLAGDGARVRMHLTPRELGEVVVRLEVKDGLAHAHLIADTPDAGRMLQAAMGDLRSALADRGLRLDTVDVRVSGDAGGPMQGHTGPRQEGHGHQKPARMPFSFGRLEAMQPVEAPLAAGEPATPGVSVLA